MDTNSTLVEEETLLLSAKDFPGIRKDDIVKITSAEDDSDNHLVIKEISLEMIEVVFKDQYVSRSDMWRLKRYLVGSCTCVEEKIKYCDIRAQVNELWISGCQVKCGLVADSTRIVLRSASSLVYIFVQMSKEMWEFDGYGQLQFEKAVNGFLKELFVKWKDKSYHEFTLVLFSRSYFKTANIEDFPYDIRYVVQKDYRGYFYIDFYYSITHHERSDDCSPHLSQLKKLFNEYKSIINIPGCPESYNSTASEGNFLEAINMSLNVFDKHYIDRNFDRTGQIVICITPGVGVFDVDRSLTILTKERMIDNGIGSDLVCLGEQPLHAVPLFKFHSKHRSSAQSLPAHSFNIPHWINHSFYSLNPFQDQGTVGIKHIPRTDLHLKKSAPSRSIQSPTKDSKPLQPDLPTLLGRNFEEFDDEVFNLPEYPRSRRKYKNSVSDSPRHVPLGKRPTRIRTTSEGPARKSSDDYFMGMGTSPLRVPNTFSRRFEDARTASSLEPARNIEKYFTIKEDEEAELIVGSAHSFRSKATKAKKQTQRSLINPFVAMSTLAPSTSNGRRWVHTYPISRDSESSGIDSLDGIRRLSETISESSDVCEDDPSVGKLFGIEKSQAHVSNSIVGSVNSSEISNGSSRKLGRFSKVMMRLNNLSEKEFPLSPDVNWKAQKFPACLPITNDYFPSKQRLILEYLETSYKLIPDNEEVLGADQTCVVVTTREIFLELVNQRLSQGFQLVVPKESNKRLHYDSTSIHSGRKSPISLRKDTSFTSTESTSPAYAKIPGSITVHDNDECYTLNHGRQYHIITLNEDNEIIVKVYKPRHNFSSAEPIDYKYLLWAVGRDRFRLTKVRFAHEQYESYHWNYQDNCVCSRGDDTDFQIQESIKYWRSKFLVIPSYLSRLRYQKAETIASIDQSRKTRYDLFNTDEPPQKNLTSAYEGMVKFFDFINKLRHAVPGSRKDQKAKDAPHGSPASLSYSNIGSSLNSPESHSTAPRCATPTGQERTSHHSRSGSRTEQGHPDPKVESPRSEPGDAPRVRFSADTCAIKVYEEMMLKNTDFLFLQHQGRLPQYSFLSFDAVNWCLKKDFGLRNASEAVAVFEVWDRIGAESSNLYLVLSQNLRKAKQICHASGDGGQQFAFGYYVFHVVTNEGNQSNYDSSCHQFEHHWLELGFGSVNAGLYATEEQNSSGKPKSVLSHLIESESGTSPRRALKNVKSMLIPLNNKAKTERSEWCQIQYPASIHPWHGSVALTFNIQWLVATATCLFEMLYGWLREANRCNLNLIPSPNDPFAFPDSEKDASPLHCPLFVPLNMKALTAEVKQLNDMLSQVMDCRRRIILFMEKIAIRFGFLRYYSMNSGKTEGSANLKNCRRFVHYTGQAFLEIPVTNDFRVQGRTVTTRDHLNITSSAKENLESKSEVNLEDCGFYLSVNRMLTKRWRSSYCDDCPVDKLDADFILFCTNEDGRLLDLYNNIYSCS